jgi:putative solute:sodium symporter small subunit
MDFPGQVVHGEVEPARTQAAGLVLEDAAQAHAGNSHAEKALAVQPESAPGACDQGYWRYNCTWIAGLLAIWTLATLGVPWAAAWLSGEVGSWPAGFWACAQGLPLLYLALAVLYDAVMVRRERSGSGAPTQPR